MPSQPRVVKNRLRAREKSPTKGPKPAAYSGNTEHVVFLVPGLLGFENFSTFRYFSDRVTAALRAGLEQRLGTPVPVVALPTAPTASLAVRQQMLVRAIADRSDMLQLGDRPFSVHLIGHSTGGLDANHLTCTRPLAAASWSELDRRAPALLERVRSVVSIASPLQGACITRAPAARLLSHRELRGLPQLLGLLGKFAMSSLSDVELGDFLTSSLHEAGKAARFVGELTRRWALLDDLDPSRSVPLTDLRREVVRRSFVTISGRAPLGEDSVTPPDSFFRALATRAAGWETGCAEEGERVLSAVRALQRACGPANDNMIIAANGVHLPSPIDAGHNDGVVNSARQLLDPQDPEELAAIVVADHFDVVGYYDRSIWTVDDAGREQAQHVLAGLLHSGSHFRDDQFFELYSRIADVVARAAQAEQGEVPVHAS
jgi:pimeloyl-ACP methyl ester carboxylesterase